MPRASGRWCDRSRRTRRTGHAVTSLLHVPTLRAVLAVVGGLNARRVLLSRGARPGSAGRLDRTMVYVHMRHLLGQTSTAQFALEYPGAHLPPSYGQPHDSSAGRSGDREQQPSPVALAGPAGEHAP